MRTNAHMEDTLSSAELSWWTAELLLQKQDLYVPKEPTQWAVRKVVFRDAIEVVHLSQYMSTVDATGYYISNYNWFQNFLLQFLEKNA